LKASIEQHPKSEVSIEQQPRLQASINPQPTVTAINRLQSKLK
jgi:hypothetical protein